MSLPKIGTRQEWLEARLELLKKEKAHSRARDDLTRERQALPWVKVEKEYIFEGPSGKVTLSDLFGNKSQLIVQHFMFDPEWDEGCKSCSFMADHMDPSVIHIATGTQPSWLCQKPRWRSLLPTRNACNGASIGYPLSIPTLTETFMFHLPTRKSKTIRANTTFGKACHFQSEKPTVSAHSGRTHLATSIIPTRRMVVVPRM